MWVISTELDVLWGALSDLIKEVRASAFPIEKRFRLFLRMLRSLVLPRYGSRGLAPRFRLLVAPLLRLRLSHVLLLLLLLIEESARLVRLLCATGVPYGEQRCSHRFLRLLPCGALLWQGHLSLNWRLRLNTL